MSTADTGGFNIDLDVVGISKPLNQRCEKILMGNIFNK
jgi:hypothetical protein